MTKYDVKLQTFLIIVLKYKCEILKKTFCHILDFIKIKIKTLPNFIKVIKV